MYYEYSNTIPEAGAEALITEAPKTAAIISGSAACSVYTYQYSLYIYILQV